VSAFGMVGPSFGMVGPSFRSLVGRFAYNMAGITPQPAAYQVKNITLVVTNFRGQEL